MKNLSPKEAITILEGMRIDIPLPKAAVTQIKRNLALDMAINALNCSEIPNNSDTISRQAAIDALRAMQTYKLFAGDDMLLIDQAEAQTELIMLPYAQPKRGKWIRDRSGAYCCNKCMEPCATYAMMKPRDKFCKMCGADMRGEQE